MMTTIATRPSPDNGAAVIGRAATMPPVTGPGRPGRASRTRLHLTVADRALHCRAGNRRHPAGHGTASQPSPAACTGR